MNTESTQKNDTKDFFYKLHLLFIFNMNEKFTVTSIFYREHKLYKITKWELS